MDPLYRTIRIIEIDWGREAALEYIRAVAFVPAQAENIRARAWEGFES